MNLAIPKPLRLWILVPALSIGFASCGDNSDVEGSDKPTTKDTASSTFKYNGKIFSIPSPIQTADLIKKSGAGFNGEMLNPPNKVSNYSTDFQRALNLGVYGADLGYAVMYEQNAPAMGYFTSVQRLADQLKLSSAFDKTIIEKISANIGNRDSVLALVSEAYRRSDDFLKESQRNNLGALIIAGGWIESLYFATDVLKRKPNDQVKQRIAEQKTTVKNLIELLKDGDNPDNLKLAGQLEELASLFEGIEIKYEFIPSTHDVANKTTTINSKTSVTITPEQVDAISQKIQDIRKSIVG